MSPVLAAKKNIATETSRTLTTPGFRPRFSWKPIAIFLEVLASLVIVVLLLEAIFAWAGVGEQEFLRIDANRGFAPMENKSVTWRSEGFSRVKFNSFGMQDKPRSLVKSPDTLRVAIVGDSWVEALQVDREKNFCSILERLLNESEGKRAASEKNGVEKRTWEVLNFGVSSYNLGQVYIQVRDQAMRFQPDLVIVPVRVDTSQLLATNPEGGFLSARPNFFVDGDGQLIEDRTVQNIWLKSKDAKRMRTTAWLREHSRIWGVMGRCAEALAGWNKSGGFWKRKNQNLTALDNGKSKEQSQSSAQSSKPSTTRTNGSVTSSTWPCADPQTEAASESLWPIGHALIKAMQTQCDNQNCRFLIVRLPGPNGYVNKKEQSCLERTVVELVAPFLDLTDVFHDRLKQSDEKLFYTYHATPAGHKMIAEKIFATINDDPRLKELVE